MDSDDEGTTVIYQNANDIETAGGGKRRKNAVEFDNRSDASDRSGEGSGRQRKKVDAFEGEFGYAVVKALRGKTVGRRMRRAIFKFGFIQLFCGIPLFIMTCLIYDNFRNSEFYDSPKYGLTLMELMWLVSLPTFLMGLVTMTAAKNWPSLVTNRKLLSNLVRCYMIIFIVLFMFTLWMISVTFLTFMRIEDWGETVTIAAIFPYYVCAIIFTMPYLTAQFYYLLDLSYLVEEMDMGGVIAEPDPPDDVMDLTDVTLLQSCLFVFAMPCILCIQCFDLIKALKQAYNTYYRDQPFFLSDRKKKQRKEEPPKKKRRVLRRMWKTLMRMFRGQPKRKDNQVQPEETIPPPQSSKEAAAEAAQPAPDLELAELTRDREEEERRQREAAAKEREELLHKQRLEEEEREAEKRRQEENALIEAARQLHEQKKKQAEEEAKKKAAEAAFEATLSVAKFKALWTSLGTAGSFQCNLKALPELKALTEHLKKNSFHVVFASQPSPTDLEIGVCNQRKAKNEAWFMARFLATPTNFSAVMKAEKADEVTGFVKKFALAKVLKIQK